MDLSRQYLHAADVKALAEGKYYITNPVNAPNTLTSYVNIQESPINEQRKSIEVVPVTGNTKYIARLSDNGTWSAWDRYVLDTDLGARTIALTSLIVDLQDSTFNYLHISGNVVELNVDIVSDGVSGEVDVVQIPTEYMPSRHIYTQCRVATSNGVNSSAYCIIYAGSGKLRVILPTTYTARNISAHFCWII